MSVLVTGERKTINSELWHACAGPLVSLPPVGSLVVYFPQGHSEQVWWCLIAYTLILEHDYFLFGCPALMEFILPAMTFRLQHPCKRRLISYPVILTFHPS